jgi:excisionase family DNA binding protein
VAKDDHGAALLITRATRYEDLPDMVTPDEAGRFLGLSRNSAYAWLHGDDVPKVRFGRLIRIPKTALIGQVR